MRSKTRLFAAAAVAAVIGLTAACSGAQSTEAPAQNAAATIVDVRTASEYAEGHLQGAINIDVQGSDFAQRIESLDTGAAYRVYCRSGNRSAQAAAAMKQAGLTKVEDLGGISQAASATGLPVVKG
ncbi:rhodanese-like domain-containing protein [Rarobacter incanus]|uniref:Rhodanese-related sulfurtransferase n=1 Tax=Rarobacter incanus TaxID=153494 RepID=A0A542SPT6_9MICO|nr:rhodanese-like domain-containing protein [Rarobacter incanus]TQK76633.1 rhodanese-related sulfurtransferase [Rarobacter incanus]